LDSKTEQLVVSCLTCESLTNPLGIDSKAPHLSWKIESTEYHVMQTGYQVVVAETKENVLNGVYLWDTGKINSDQSINIRYDGPTLQSRERRYWKVRVWDNKGRVSSWSEIAFWEMGLLQENDWKAKWVVPHQEMTTLEGAIGLKDIFGSEHPLADETKLHPCPILRHEFTLKKDKIVKRGRVYATAHGVYELELNGRKVGDFELAPEFTSYDQYLQYQTYDITDLLKVGRSNAVGVTLADGWYSGRIAINGDSAQYGRELALLLQLEIEYEDGEKQFELSGEQFLSSFGPIRYSDLFIGEKYDARLGKKGWSSPSYHTEGWHPVEIRNYGYHTLVAQFGEPVRAICELPAKKLVITPIGETVIDFGQVIAGRVKMIINEPSGTEITFEHSEVLDEHGHFIRNILGRNKDQVDKFIASGSGEEIFEPKFTYHGFRFIKISGMTRKPILEDCKAVVLSSDLIQTGKFSTSDPRINQLQSNIEWSQRGNMFSIPTDCPQREKAGWTGDIQVFAPTATYNFQVKSFLERWLRNVRVEQHPDGQIPVIVPFIESTRDFQQMIGGSSTSAGWGDACIIVPWILFQSYGDKRVLEENYEMMENWVKYIEESAKEFPESFDKSKADSASIERQQFLWNTGFHFGDWLIPSLSISQNGEEVNMMQSAFATKELVATCYYAYSTELLGEISKLLGYTDRANEYFHLNEKVRKAFKEEYILPSGKIKGDFQGIYVLALKMGMADGQLKEKVAAQLVHLIKENGNKLDTGFMSVNYLMDVLVDNGFERVAYDLLFQTDCPSWLYQVEKGATTIWESWQSIMPNGKVTKTSFNHYAFGCIGDWMYRHIAGINRMEPGFKKIVIHPHFDSRLTNASGEYESEYGKIRSSWELTNGKLSLDIEIPVNTTAKVVIDDRNGRLIESNLEQVLSIDHSEDNIVIDIGSGHYQFKILQNHHEVTTTYLGTK
jgi:alpha-L-rhamnosidase